MATLITKRGNGVPTAANLVEGEQAIDLQTGRVYTLSGGAVIECGADPHVIDFITDVDTTTTAPADGEVLTFDGASNLWIPQAAGGSLVDKPFIISPTEGVTGFPAASSIEASTFFAVSGGAHASSTWEIYSDPTLATQVYTVTPTSGTERTVLTTATGLLPGTTYYVQVKYTDSLGNDSEYSVPRQFTVKGAITGVFDTSANLFSTVQTLALKFANSASNKAPNLVYNEYHDWWDYPTLLEDDEERGETALGVVAKGIDRNTGKAQFFASHRRGASTGSSRPPTQVRSNPFNGWAYFYGASNETIAKPDIGPRTFNGFIAGAQTNLVAFKDGTAETIALTSSGLRYSTNGTNFGGAITANTPGTCCWDPVANIWRGVGNGELSVTSANGTTWTTGPQVRVDGALNSFRAGGEMFYSKGSGLFIVGRQKEHILTSPDGVNWTKYDNDGTNLEQNGTLGLQYAPGNLQKGSDLLYGMNMKGTLWITSDGGVSFQMVTQAVPGGTHVVNQVLGPDGVYIFSLANSFKSLTTQVTYQVI
jgi:hypothetical protein